MDWERVAAAFVWDGTLRDVVVPGTDERDWKALLAHLRTGVWPLLFAVGQRPAPLPGSAERLVFRRSETELPLLIVDPGRLHLACSFVAPSEIEFVFDPRDVTGPDELARLLGFVRELGLVVGKPVLVFRAGARARAHFRFDPASWRLDYRPDG